MASMEAFLTLCFSSVTAIFIAFYYYFTRNFKFWQKLGVPYIKPIPFVGNLKDCVLLKKNVGELLHKIYEEHNDKPYVGIFTFANPSLLIRDAELVKNILVKDSQYFIDRVISFKENRDPLIGRFLFVIRGHRWRRLRTHCTPAFTSVKLKMMFNLVDICGKELSEYLDKITADGSPVEVTETMSRFTIDVIASCAFGINGNSFMEPDPEFRRQLLRVLHFSFRQALVWLTAFCSPYLMSLFNMKILDVSTENYFRNIVWSTVEYREKHGEIRRDFLNSLMELRNKGKKDYKEDMLYKRGGENDPTFQLDGDDFVAQVFGFMIAGYETSATVLSFALYEIALHPEIQHRLRIEILQVLNKHNGELTYDGIQQMSYLDMVVSETMRKYPIIGFLDRMCSSDYQLPNPTGDGTVTLPAGTGVYIPVLGLHYDPAYFPEPQKFDPERFTEEEKQRRPNYTYIPFGEGPRMCLGVRFGLMEVKTGLCHVLSRFEVAPCKDTPMPVVFDSKAFLLKTDGEVPLSFKRRQF